MTGPRWFAWGWVAGAASAALLYNCLAYAASPGYLQLTWTATNMKPATYSVYRSPTPPAAPVLMVSGLTVLAYRVSGLKIGSTHCYVVKATVNGKDSADSNRACKKVPRR